MPIVGIGICFAIAAVYTTLTMEVSAFFAQTMFNVVIITAFCAVLQSSLVSLFPEGRQNLNPTLCLWWYLNVGVVNQVKATISKTNKYSQY